MTKSSYTVKGWGPFSYGDISDDEDDDEEDNETDETDEAEDEKYEVTEVAAVKIEIAVKVESEAKESQQDCPPSLKM